MSGERDPKDPQGVLTPKALEQARGHVIAAMASGMVPAAWARFLPDHPAILSALGNRTFAELNGRMNQLARALRGGGLKEGDGVALLCRNRPEFTEVAGACRRAGLRLTPVNWHLGGEEAGYIVDNCDAKALIADAHFSAAGEQAARNAPKAQVRLCIDGTIDGFDSYEDALSVQPSTDISDPTGGTTMLYTSGTTGRPKGVSRSAVSPRQRPAMLGDPTVFMGGYEPGCSVHLVTGPLYHSAPISFSMGIPHMFGATLVMMDKWDAEESLRLIEQHRVTHTHMVPTMFHRLLALPDAVRAKYDVSSLTFVIHGAAPCPVHVKRALIEWLGPVVHEYYAATEGVGTVVDSQTWLEKPGTVGKPRSPEHIKILDEQGQSVAPGEIGRVFIVSPEGSRFAYHKDDDETRKAFVDDHFTLGDVGYLDEDGFLFLTDRSTELIISGGVNIYPAEVEEVLLRHPLVRDAAVIGVPNTDWGEEVKAIVELVADTEPEPQLAEALITLCQTHLAKYKCPRSVDFVDALPRSDSGKLYKRTLREQYRQRSGNAD